MLAWKLGWPLVEREYSDRRTFIDNFDITGLDINLVYFSSIIIFCCVSYKIDFIISRDFIIKKKKKNRSYSSKSISTIIILPYLF